MGAAAPLCLDQPVPGQQAQGLPHGLAADLVLLGNGELRWQDGGAGVFPGLDVGPQRVGHRLIFGRHRHLLFRG